MANPFPEDPPGTLTVHWDDGKMPRFEKFANRADALHKIEDLATEGRIAIILEDYND